MRPDTRPTHDRRSLAGVSRSHVGPHELDPHTLLKSVERLGATDDVVVLELRTADLLDGGSR